MVILHSGGAPDDRGVLQEGALLHGSRERPRAVLGSAPRARELSPGVSLVPDLIGIAWRARELSPRVMLVLKPVPKRLDFQNEVAFLCCARHPIVIINY